MKPGGVVGVDAMQPEPGQVMLTPSSDVRHGARIGEFLDWLEEHRDLNPTPLFQPARPVTVGPRMGPFRAPSIHAVLMRP